MLLHAFAGEVLGEISVARAARTRSRPRCSAGSTATWPSEPRRCRMTPTPTAATAPPSTSTRCARSSRFSASRRTDSALVYLDNAATTQKPRVVLDAHLPATTRRRTPTSTAASTCCRSGRPRPSRRRAPRRRRSLGAAHTHEIVFTRNATEGINLVAQSWGGRNLTAGDEVLISAMEHHSNIVPWQLACERTGARLRVIPIDDRGVLDLRGVPRGCSPPRTRMVAVSHLSNALGTVNPVAEIVTAAHAAGAAVLVDGAQAAYHRPVDVRALGVDFYVCTGHKLYGPTGIGVLYGTHGAARGDAAVPGRRRHDFVGDLREEHLERPAVQVRGRHAAYRRGDRPGGGDALHAPRRLRLDHRARGATARLRHRGAVGACPACASSAPRPTRPASCRS